MIYIGEVSHGHDEHHEQQHEADEVHAEPAAA
jgi:hypothetical protein